MAGTSSEEVDNVMTHRSEHERVRVARIMSNDVDKISHMSEEEQQRFGILCEMAIFQRSKQNYDSMRYKSSTQSALTRLNMPDGKEVHDVPLGNRIMKPDSWYFVHTPQGARKREHEIAVEQNFKKSVNERLEKQKSRTKHLRNGMPPCKNCKTTEFISQVGERHARSMDEMAYYKYMCRQCGMTWEQK